MESFKLTKTATTWDLEVCPKCGSTDWQLDRSHIDHHGHGIRCASCGYFLKWTGKGKAKANNKKFRALHKKDGELICDLCGITENEAKRLGWHFEMDHREAENFGGEDSHENSRPLCSPCHYQKTALEHRTRGIRRLLNADKAPDQNQ